MKQHARSNGFSLIELVVAMAAAAVLALTAGLMLVYAYKAWRQDRDGAAMQQDGSVALELISRAVRSGSNVVVQSGFPGDLRATLTNRTMRIFADEQNLVYDPSLAVTGDEVVVIEGRLSAFAVTNTAGTVSVVLQMEAGDGFHRETLEGSYTCRNNN